MHNITTQLVSTEHSKLLFLLQQRPLTRYLPVRESSCPTFDLRQHIETAGHQVDEDGDTCRRHLVLNSSTCRGYLRKMGASRGLHGRRVWNRRWFVFDRQKKSLVYYADKTESRAKGGIYFRVSSDKDDRH